MNTYVVQILIQLKIIPTIKVIYIHFPPNFFTPYCDLSLPLTSSLLTLFLKQTLMYSLSLQISLHFVKLYITGIIQCALVLQDVYTQHHHFEDDLCCSVHRVIVLKIILIKKEFIVCLLLCSIQTALYSSLLSIHLWLKICASSLSFLQTNLL